MSTLSYADEVIDPAEIDELQGLEEIDVSDREVRMAESLVESLAAAFQAEYRDSIREQVLDLIKIKAAGEGVHDARGRGREAEGRRPDGGARGQRACRQGRSRAPPCSAGRVEPSRRRHRRQAAKIGKAAAKSTKAAMSMIKRRPSRRRR